MIHDQDHITSVWVLTEQQQLKKVDIAGGVQEKSRLKFASAISCSIDKTLWVLTINKNTDNNQILYSDDEAHSWIDINLPQIRVTKIAATHLGNCFLITPQGAVFLVQKSGKISKVFGEGTANDIAVSPEGFIWIISREKKPGGGNLIYWCTYGNYVLQPAYGQPVAKKIAAGIDGVARIVTSGGEVASLYVNRMGGLESPGGKEFAKEIATSMHSNTIWVISRDTSKNKKQNILKYWNPDTDPYMKWHTILGVDPLKIAGAD